MGRCGLLRLNSGCGVSCRSLGQQHQIKIASWRSWADVVSFYRRRGQSTVYEGRRRVAACLKGSRMSRSVFRKRARADAYAAVKAELRRMGGGRALHSAQTDRTSHLQSARRQLLLLHHHQDELPSNSKSPPCAGRTSVRRRVPGLDPAYVYGRPLNALVQDTFQSRR